MIEKQIFVARQLELERLDSFLNRSINGEGQICFITGEAGIGKTALITEFARIAQEKNQDLIVAYGQSDAQTGMGDPYLPFREIMEQLTGDTESKLARGTISQENANRLQDFLKFSARAIVDVGPDLIGIFVPAAGLVTRLGAFVASETGLLKKISEETEKRAVPEFSGIDQGHIFEQYTNVLVELAKRKPLVLVLDDLQWADSASLSLLFRIGRRIGGSRILIIGCYRPEEVALSRSGERHPLEKVLAEFKRYFGEITINLDEIGESERSEFVGAYLDTEPNRLSDQFCRALYEHTGGHPLFTIELLRDLQDRGDILKDADGNWTERPGLDWSVLPARVEGVIEERIGRLEDELREALTVASTEGEDFTAEVVARVQALNARQLVHRLSAELEKKHHLVKAQGLRNLESQHLSLYRFHHNLIQHYLYDRLDAAERTYLHAEVGDVLEELYGDKVDEIAVQLAHHYLNAGRPVKERTYLQMAGESAALRYANAEAELYFNRALELMPPEENLGRFQLLKQREKVYHQQGKREAQRQDLDEMLRLSEGMQAKERAYVMFRVAKFNESIGEFNVALEYIEKSLSLAQECHDLQSEATAHQLLGLLQLRAFDHEIARTNLDTALRIAQELGDRRMEGNVLNNIGFAYDNLGDSDQARAYYLQSMEIARQVGDLMLEARTLNNVGLIYREQGDPDKARTCYENSMNLLQKVGYRKGVGVLLQNIGILYAGQADYAHTMEAFNQALQISREVDDKLSEGRLLGNLGAACAEQGDLVSARSYFEQSVKIAQDIGNRHGEAYGMKNLGEVYSELGDFSAARTLFDQTLIIAREIEDPQIESFALNALGRYHADSGDYSRAIALIEESLAIKRKIGNRAEEGSSLDNLGLVFDQLGEFVRAKKLLEESFNIHHELGDRTGESLCLALRGLVFHHSGEQALALESSARAVEIAREIGNRSYQSLALMVSGYCLMALGRLAEAESAYRGSLAIRREQHQEHLIVEPQAGLAEVFLAEGSLSRAMTQAGEVYDSLMKRTPDGTLEPMRSYLACYQVLRAVGDLRAAEILNTAVRVLQERAAKLGDEDLRRSYLENVGANRVILGERA